MSRRDKNSDNIEQRLHDTDNINKEGERDLLGLTEEDYRDIARGLKERELKYGFVPEGPETIEEVRFNYEDETEAKDPAKEGETDKQEPPKEEKKKKKGGFKNWLKTGRPWVNITLKGREKLPPERMVPGISTHSSLSSTWTYMVPL